MEQERYTKALYFRMRPVEKSLLSRAASASDWLTMSKIVRQSLYGGGKIHLNTEFIETIEGLHNTMCCVENLVIMSRVNLAELSENPLLGVEAFGIHDYSKELSRMEKGLSKNRENLVKLAKYASDQMEEIRTPTRDPDAKKLNQLEQDQAEYDRRSILWTEGFKSRCGVRITRSQGHYLNAMARACHEKHGRPLNKSRIIRSSVVGVVFVGIGPKLVEQMEILADQISEAGEKLLRINGFLRDLIEDPFLAEGAGRAIKNSLQEISETRRSLDESEDELHGMVLRLYDELKKVSDGYF